MKKSFYIQFAFIVFCCAFLLSACRINNGSEDFPDSEESSPTKTKVFFMKRIDSSLKKWDYICDENGQRLTLEVDFNTKISKTNDVVVKAENSLYNLFSNDTIGSDSYEQSLFYYYMPSYPPLWYTESPTSLTPGVMFNFETDDLGEQRFVKLYARYNLEESYEWKQRCANTDCNKINVVTENPIDSRINCENCGRELNPLLWTCYGYGTSKQYCRVRFMRYDFGLKAWVSAYDEYREARMGSSNVDRNWNSIGFTDKNVMDKVLIDGYDLVGWGYIDDSNADLNIVINNLDDVIFTDEQLSNTGNYTNGKLLYCFESDDGETGLYGKLSSYNFMRSRVLYPIYKECST